MSSLQFRVTRVSTVVMNVRHVPTLKVSRFTPVRVNMILILNGNASNWLHTQAKLLHAFSDPIQTTTSCSADINPIKFLITSSSPFTSTTNFSPRYLDPRNFYNHLKQVFPVLSRVIDNHVAFGGLESVSSLLTDNALVWRLPAQTPRWWFSALRVAETTSCTWCGTSSFASWELSQPDTAPSCLPCSRTQRKAFPLRDVERNQLYPNVEVESAKEEGSEMSNMNR